MSLWVVNKVEWHRNRGWQHRGFILHCSNVLRFKYSFLPWKFCIEFADPVRSRSPYARSLAAKTTVIPFRRVVRNERKFSGEHPPLAVKNQIATRYVTHQKPISLAEFRHMLSQPRTKRSLAFRRTFRRLADVNKLMLEIQCIDTAFIWTHALCKWRRRAGFKFFHDLRANSSVEVKLKIMRIIG